MGSLTRPSCCRKAKMTPPHGGSGLVRSDNDTTHEAIHDALGVSQFDGTERERPYYRQPHDTQAATCGLTHQRRYR